MSLPSINQVDVSFSDTSSSTVDNANVQLTPEAIQFRLAQSYQEYMKQMPIPVERGAVIPYISWMGLGKSIEQIYGQPLHYLTYLHLKQLDKVRISAKDEHVPLDMIIHPDKAETSIWNIEEIHRRTASPLHLAHLWKNDPSHYAVIDAIIPKLSS